MQTRKPPFTSRNIICAIVLGLIAAGYWLAAWQMSIEIQQAARNGFDGEVNGMVVLLSFAFAAYTALFSLATLPTALRRGTKPMSWGVLILGLLPTLLLFLILAASFLPRSSR